MKKLIKLFIELKTNVEKCNKIEVNHNNANIYLKHIASLTSFSICK